MHKIFLEVQASLPSSVFPLLKKEIKSKLNFNVIMCSHEFFDLLRSWVCGFFFRIPFKTSPRLLCLFSMVTVTFSRNLVISTHCVQTAFALMDAALCFGSLLIICMMSGMRGQPGFDLHVPLS